MTQNQNKIRLRDEIIVPFFAKHNYSLKNEENIVKAFKRLAKSHAWNETTKRKKKVEMQKLIAGHLEIRLSK